MFYKGKYNQRADRWLNEKKISQRYFIKNNFFNILIFKYLNLALQDGCLFSATNQKTDHRIVSNFGTLLIHTFIYAFNYNYSSLEKSMKNANIEANII